MTRVAAGPGRGQVGGFITWKILRSWGLYLNTQKMLAGFRSVLVTACMVGVILSANGQPLHLPVNDPDNTLRPFLQKCLTDLRFKVDKTTRFSWSLVRRSDGTTDEVVVYVQGQSWCGSGGCTLLILEPDDFSYEVIGRASIVRLPIRVLSNTTKGHHDIGVWVQGGGIQPGYEAVLQFNGKAYPSNPTVPLPGG